MRSALGSLLLLDCDPASVETVSLWWDQRLSWRKKQDPKGIIFVATDPVAVLA